MDSEKNKNFTVDEKELLGGKVVEKMNSGKNKIARGILSNMTSITACAILVVATAVFFTDIKLTDLKALAELSLTVGVLWFCSYSMYLNLSDAGVNAGRQNQSYIEQIALYEAKADAIKTEGRLGRLREFCAWYTEEELKQARKNALCDIPYEKYTAEYAGRSSKQLQQSGLTKNEIRWIKSADKLRPITLNPDKILKRGRGDSRRNPLGVSPETKLTTKKIVKAFNSVLLSMFTGSILLDVTLQFTWATFAACMLKLLTILLSGLWGYKAGYSNITVSSLNYVKDQISLIDQFNNYCDTTNKGRE